MVVKKEYIFINCCLLLWSSAIAGDFLLTNGDFEAGNGSYDANGWTVFDGYSGGKAVYFAPGEQPNEYLENADINSHRAASLKSNDGPFIQQVLNGVWGVFYDRYTIDCSLGYRNDAFTDGDLPIRVSVWDVTNDRELSGEDIILADPGFASGGVPTAQWERYRIILEVDTATLSDEKIAVRFTNSKSKIVSARATALIDNVTLTVPDVTFPVRPVWPEDDTINIPIDHEPAPRDYDYEDRITITLEPGINRILVKVKADAPLYYEENHFPSQNETYPWVIEAWGFYCLMDMGRIRLAAF